MTARLTISEAARIARASTDDVQAALDAGDLRNLTRPAVTAWARARTASTISRSLRP